MSMSLPLSSMRLLAPPLRLMSACVWQVAQERSVQQYGKMADFISLLTHLLPQLLRPTHTAQLLLGLRARLILEMLQQDTFDPKTIEEHLKNISQWSSAYAQKEKDELELKKQEFVTLVQKLLSVPADRTKFFKEVFPVQYGQQFDTNLQGLVWDLLCRLEEVLPVPSFSQIATSSSLVLRGLDEIDQCFSDPEELKVVLQLHKLPGDPEETQDNQTSEEDSLEEEEGMEEGSAEAAMSAQKEPLSLTTAPPCPDMKPSKACTGKSIDPPHPENQEAPVTNKRKTKRPVKITEAIAVQEVIQDATADVAETPAPSDDDTNGSSSKKHPCPQCGKRFKSPGEVKQHQDFVHVLVNRFECDQCEKKFKTESCLKRHAQTHTDHKPHICSYCNRGFRSNDILKRHLRTHTGERPYACSLCDRRFTQMYMLTVHMRVHKDDRPYLCSECGKGFCDSGALLVHSRQHTGERPFGCDICGKSFSASHKLKTHIRYHTGERPYPCPECGKRFHTQSGLKKHTRTHSAEKPFQCPTCPAKYTQQYNLRAHMLTHT